MDNVSFTVPSGSIVGFIGENGAGKTTTIKCILDLVHIDSGSITLLGQDHIAGGSKAREDIGVVFDECSFHDWLRADQVGKILKNTYKNWDAEYYLQLLQRFQLDHLTGKKDILKTYSRGMKMKLSLAAALAHHPKLLILDEATSGLDPIVRDEILDLFMDFIQDEDHSILFSSHITTDIEKSADYLVFIHQGRIVLYAEKDELLSNYAIVHATKDSVSNIPSSCIVGKHPTSFGIDILVNNRASIQAGEDLLIEKATIDDIMLYTIRGTKL